MKSHIFVVDDEKNIRELIKKYLEKENYRVTLFADAENLVSAAEKENPDLIVLDIMMPGKDGLTAFREMQKAMDIPVIFVTARGEEIDRILGLELGADDYMTKPFSPRELMARVKNILRRREKAGSAAVSAGSITYRDLEINLSKRTCSSGNGDIYFTSKEYELLTFLVQNKNISFTRDQLIDKVWGMDFLGDERGIDDLVKRIRKKLRTAGSEADITTVWGFGYRVDG